MADSLILRALDPADEEPFRRAHRALAEEGFTFGLGYDEDVPFATYVRQMERQRHGEDLPPRWVPNTFLVAVVDGELVGRTSIRHELNDFLATEGGHIGYAVLREHRRRGYATEILRRSVDLARRMGIDRVLVTCDDDNVGSAAVIEACGGVLDGHIVGESGAPMRRYWIG